MLRVRANIGEGFRSPTADQLAADYRHWGTRYVGNPDLDPETSQTYDLGFDLPFTRVLPLALTRLDDRWLVVATLYDARPGAAPDAYSPWHYGGWLLGPAE